ncbi:MAG: hypothetical protein VX498_01450, partial [Myxococcota bacterium]|nr:hypothetical protein [Myxococcota bacterium]
ARTIKHASTGVSESEAPREVVGRGYYVCDGCLALLDYRVEHHLDPKKHSVFNLLSSLYQFFAVWLVIALSALASLAGTGDPDASLLKSPGFLTLGILLAFVGLVVWFLRTLVHTRYFGTWRAARQGAQSPKNSLAGFTNLRDRLNPELGAYLPVRFEDSRKLLKKPGSPALRCIGPNGEPWGQGPTTNFSGRGANEWYRVVWISWRLWPLTQILEPEGADWTPPPEPAVSEIEAACAGLFSALAFSVFSFTRLESPFFWVLAALLSWPVGFFVGRQARELWRDRKIAQSSQPLG